MLTSYSEIQSVYDGMVAHAKRSGLPQFIIDRVSGWSSGEWVTYLHYVLFHLPVSPRGKVVLDFGCGCGALAPLLLALDCAKYVGADVLQALDDIRRLHEAEKENVSFVNVDEGYIEAQPETIDIIIANEMISHVQPRDLPTVYAEWARVLKPGGVLFISDGNKLDDPAHWQVLLNLYDVIENGPVGAAFGTPPFTATVDNPYVNQRKAIVKSRHPTLSDEAIDFVAKNTSGMYGQRLDAVIDNYVASGQLTRRPYRRGQAPVVPSTGVIQEQGFRPQQVVLALMPYGFTCVARVDSVRPPASWSGCQTAFSYPSSNFQIIATKA